ncbi:MAG: hypothetical protein AAF993_12885 [Pseudomonadota bacterium]
MSSPRNGHSRLSFFCGEALYEIKMGLTSLVVPLVIVVLSAYMLLIFLNADYMRAMGAVDIYRNSAHLTYLMASGQSLWLYFGWAWLFAQVIVRDQNAQLQEVVLASPIPLHLTLSARFVGALAVAVVMGAAVFLGFAAAPILVTLGALPPEAVGPMPVAAFGWSILAFTLPNALGTGALFVCAAIWTRSTAGPFSAAAGLALVWMLAMIVLRGGEVDVTAASVLDPSGYSEAERQSMLWTPVEKKSAVIALTDLWVYNRLLWTGLPLVLFGWVLIRLRREQLAVAGKASVDDDERIDVPHPTENESAPLPVLTKPGWVRTTMLEAVWQFKLVTSSFGMRLALGMLLLSGALGAWVNYVGHIDGPLVPTPQGLLPFITEFFYLIIVFMVVGFVGVLMRRDDRLGYAEWVDSSYAPLAVRLVAQCLAALALIALLCVVPALSSLLVTAASAPASLDYGFPFTFLFLTLFPALAEVGIVAVIAHALFRHAGTAYVTSILVAFIAIINHEVSAVEYPPAQIAMPTHAHPSQLAGWGPWLPMVLTMGGLKIALVMVGVAASWLAWRRGSALTVAERWATARSRLLGPAGLLAASSIVAVFVFAHVLNSRLIVEGDFQTQAQAIAEDIEWEKTWWQQAAPFQLQGGRVSITLEPAEQHGTAEWLLQGLQAEQLHGTLPHGISLQTATIANRGKQQVKRDGDHFVVHTPGCKTGCNLTLRLNIEPQGWPVETAPWIHSSGVWLRAENILPRLGHDPRRIVRSLGDRANHGLSDNPPPMPALATLTPLQGVAPAGEWHWTIQGPDGQSIGAEGETNGLLDFAYVWMPDGPIADIREGRTYIVSGDRTAQLALFAQEITAQSACITESFGQSPDIKAVVQTPRDLGDMNLHNTILWAPEDVAWEAAGSGLGGWQRQFNLAQAMARQVILAQLNLRAEHGAQWLLEGVSGWAALRCVEYSAGLEAGIALRKLHADRLIETFAESDVPISTTAAAYADWLTHYATLALDNWAAADPARSPASMLHGLAERGEQTLIAALQNNLGEQTANILLAAPRAGDIRVQRSAEKLDIAASRWSWDGVGWQPIDTPTRVLLRAGKDSLWVELGAQGHTPGSGLLTDTGALFERTLDDNQL